MPKTSPFTPELREEFDRRGVVRLPGFYSRNTIDVMANQIWIDLEQRYGIIRDRPESWTVAAPAQFQALKRTGAFSALRTDKMIALADALLGAGAWDEPASWGAPLVTFPTSAPHLPNPAWHLDIGGVHRLDPLPILRGFTFLEPTLANGGGTLYVAGSHQLALEIERAHDRPVRSAPVRERLKTEHAWFANLLASRGDKLRELLRVEAQVGGRAVQLEEMTGAPGDLIIMHPATLHGTARNALARPRMMLTTWIYRREKSTR